MDEKRWIARGEQSGADMDPDLIWMDDPLLNTGGARLEIDLRGWIMGDG